MISVNRSATTSHLGAASHAALVALPKGAPRPHDLGRMLLGNIAKEAFNLGGRVVITRRPRAHALQGGGELEAPSGAELSARAPLQAHAVEQMWVGVSTSTYGRSLAPPPALDLGAHGNARRARAHLVDGQSPRAPHRLDPRPHTSRETAARWPDDRALGSRRAAETCQRGRGRVVNS